MVAGALIEGDGSETAEDGNASSWLDLSVMMEEYLDGPEVDVDLIFSEFEPVYGCITDNWPTVEPYFNETGSNCPSILPWEQQVQLLELGIKSVQVRFYPNQFIDLCGCLRWLSPKFCQFWYAAKQFSNGSTQYTFLSILNYSFSWQLGLSDPGTL